MKLSVSIPEDDLDFIDRYAVAHRVESRSGVLQRAVALLRANELGASYEAAWSEWDEGDNEIWNEATADGLGA